MIIIPQNWIQKPDEHGNGFLEAWAVENESGMGLQIPIETHRVALEDVTLGEEQDFAFIVEGSDDVKVYADKKDYDAHTDTHFAHEAYVSAGLFSPKQDKDFVPSPRAIINGTVTKTYGDSTKYGFDSDDILCTITCLGHEFDVVIHGGITGIHGVEIGNIVAGIFWIQGWPKGK